MEEGASEPRRLVPFRVTVFYAIPLPLRSALPITNTSYLRTYPCSVSHLSALADWPFHLAISPSVPPSSLHSFVNNVLSQLYNFFGNKALPQTRATVINPSFPFLDSPF